MSDAAWKAFERRIASLFPGGRRRGPDTRDSQEGGGKTDVIAAGWAVECKLLSRPSFQQLLDAARQAERNAAHPDDIPVAIVKRKNDRDINALVVMRLDKFQDFFINVEASNDD